MKARSEVFPQYFPDKVYPPNTLLVINRLVRPDLLVEIEAMAIRPRRAGARRATRKPAPRRRR